MGVRWSISATPLSELGYTPQGTTKQYMKDPETMKLRELKTHLCSDVKCEACDVMCGYGKRYLQLTEGEKR